MVVMPSDNFSYRISFNSDLIGLEFVLWRTKIVMDLMCRDLFIISDLMTGQIGNDGNNRISS